MTTVDLDESSEKDMEKIPMKASLPITSVASAVEAVQSLDSPGHQKVQAAGKTKIPHVRVSPNTKSAWLRVREDVTFIAKVKLPMVEVKMNVLHVWGVDVKSESFNVEVRVECRWEHDKDQWNVPLDEHGEINVGLDWEPDWHPQLNIRNTMAILNDWEPQHGARRVGDRVMVRGIYHFACQVHETFDLHDFPHDLADLNIRLEITNGPGFSVHCLDSAVVMYKSGIGIPDFQHVDHLPYAVRCVSSHTIEDKELTNDTLKNQLHVMMWYKRNAKYYHYNVFVLLFGVTTCAMTPWSVHWRQISDRVGLDITLLLVAVAFKQSLAAELPPVAYLSFMDRYVILCIGYLLLATFMHAAMGFMMWDCDFTGYCEFYDHLNIDMESALRIDHIMFVTWCSLWFISNAYKVVEISIKATVNYYRLAPDNVRKIGLTPGVLKGETINEDKLPLPVYGLRQRLAITFTNSKVLPAFVIVVLAMAVVLVHQVVINSDHPSDSTAIIAPH